MRDIHVITFVCLFAFAAAPFWAAENGFPRTVVDDMGKAITIPRKPARIVSLTLPTDEILLAIAEKSRLFGVSTFAADPGVSNVAPQAAGVPHKVTLNVEIILSLEPDLVFVADWSKAEDVAQLRKTGLAVYQFKSPLTVAQVRERISAVAQAIGEEEKGASLVTWMDEKLEAVSMVLSRIPRERRLTVIDYSTWGTSMGKGSSWDEIVRSAGLLNGVGGLAADEWGQVPLSKEKIIEIDPDILMVPSWVYGDPGGSDAFYKQILADPALKTLRSIREGRVYRMPENLKTSTSQYIVLAVEDLARRAYPELFK